MPFAADAELALREHSWFCGCHTWGASPQTQMVAIKGQSKPHYTARLWAPQAPRAPPRCLREHLATPEQGFGPPALTLGGLTAEATAIPGSLDPRGAAATQLGSLRVLAIPNQSGSNFYGVASKAGWLFHLSYLHR